MKSRGPSKVVCLVVALSMTLIPATPSAHAQSYSDPTSPSNPEMAYDESSYEQETSSEYTYDESQVYDFQDPYDPLVSAEESSYSSGSATESDTDPAMSSTQGTNSDYGFEDTDFSSDETSTRTKNWQLQNNLDGCASPDLDCSTLASTWTLIDSSGRAVQNGILDGYQSLNGNPDVYYAQSQTYALEPGTYEVQVTTLINGQAIDVFWEVVISDDTVGGNDPVTTEGESNIDPNAEESGNGSGESTDEFSEEETNNNDETSTRTKNWQLQNNLDGCASPDLDCSTLASTWTLTDSSGRAVQNGILSGYQSLNGNPDVYYAQSQTYALEPGTYEVQVTTLINGQAIDVFWEVVISGDTVGGGTDPVITAGESNIDPNAEESGNGSGESTDRAAAQFKTAYSTAINH